LRDLFKKAYLQHTTLSGATRYLANALFGQYGLIILDADDPRLKALFIPQMEQDLFENLAFQTVSNSIEELNALPGQYKAQVNPRELNFFYLQEGLRTRLVEEGGTFGVLESEIRFSEGELRKELRAHPERFSPNVISRPLYQEVVLPNLCYIGGGGELAYWLELREYFNRSGVPFPVLLLRNSALILSEKQAGKAARLGLKPAELFGDPKSLVDNQIRRISEIEIDFNPQREHLKKQFSDLYKLAEHTDRSFLGAVKAQEVKQLNGLDRLEKRLLKAQKRKLHDETQRVRALRESLFPDGGLQERNRNFAEFYLDYGPDLWDDLLKGFDPLALQFSLFTL
jgi:bacillithiol biosynthesis cysteine-adding enzyme BshC